MKILPRIVRQHIPNGLAVTAWPMGIVDASRTYYLNSEMTATMMLAIANPMLLDVRPVWLVCYIPEGIELQTTNAYLCLSEGTKETVTRDGKNYTRYRIPFSPGNTTWMRGDEKNNKYRGFVAQMPAVLWLKTSLPAGATPGKIYFLLEYQVACKGEVNQGVESWIKVAILPKVQGVTPQIALSGVMGRASIAVHPEDKVAAKIIPEYIGQLGYNFYFDGPLQSDKTKGPQRWTEGRNNWQIYGGGYRHTVTADIGVGDGFHLHVTKEVNNSIPREIAYIDNNMNPRSYAVSPWALYHKHPWVVKNVLEPIRLEILAREYEGLWANWEPQVGWMQDGDFSEGSKIEFIKWSKLPAEEVNKLWPHELVKKYPDKWRDFRNWELAQWTQILAETVRKASKEAGGNGYFVISTVNDYMDEHGKVVDCTKWPDFEYIWQTWNYYYTPLVTRDYPVTDRTGAPQVVRCGGLERHIDKVFGENHKFKTSCIYGWDQNGWDPESRGGYFTPEQLGFLHLSTVLSGMDMATNYGEWPIFDGRYATAIADANTRIARWENFCLNGKKRRDHVTIPVSPYPQKVAEYVKPSEQKVGQWEMPGYLFSYEYEKDGKRAFTIANTWDNGECFFKLKVFGLPDGKTYVLTEPEQKRIFTNDKGKVNLSAKDMANGVILHVGAMRWGVFQVEPAPKLPYPDFKVITPSEMQKAIKQLDTNKK